MSELRRDLVSGDWIIAAPDRAGRPHGFYAEKKKRNFPKKDCPFDDLEKSGEWPPILSYPKGKNWKVALIPNKYPALTHHQACTSTVAQGPYQVSSGIGHHDLVITRDHRKNFGDLNREEALQVLLVLKKRYQILAADRCLLYTSSFFNWGPAAGATLPHPHYQVLTLPIIPPDVAHSIGGSREYYAKHKRCVHCVMMDYERRKKTRIVYEDRNSIAFAPFVSRQPFEMRIFPKRHISFFEHTPNPDMRSVAHTLQTVIRGMRRNLHDPDFNFFIHSAPLKNQQKYRHYHWHIEIFPKISIRAGFELSTGVEINVVDPDRAAAILRKK
ncbi:MAG: hypothetical protein A2122_01260 [Candidatus Liptonbacteria bacterium GWB1_49_6]|uniref:DUF4921 domain-containing protein n=1 Tax=Candidatus Liptonbacteria bacterium GWB1_49_6 TaxID=1798644 RepID=A0A1G2C5U8_9BACT|nr:MAG: hypothetical protein A2122_01260 [Candidatus Liptonbacteria bacterium GWB1_49_6]